MPLDSLNRSGVQTSNPALYDTLKDLINFKDSQNTKKSTSGLFIDPSDLLPGLGSQLYNTGLDLIFKNRYQVAPISNTGTFNNYNPGVDLGSDLFFVASNPALLTINGFFAGYPGQVIVIKSLLGQINFGHSVAAAAKDTKLINSITTGVTPLNRGYAIYVYVANPIFTGENGWVLISHVQGLPLQWVPVFTGNGTLTYTGISATPTYQVIDNRVFINFPALAGTVAGAGSIINFNLPNLYTCAQGTFEIVLCNVGATSEVILLNSTTGSNNTFLERFAGVNYPAGTVTFFFDRGISIN